MIDRKELKAAARETIRQTRPHAVWVTLAVTAALLIVQGLSLSLNGDLEAYRATYESILAGKPEFVMPSGAVSLPGWLLTVALDVMGMVLSVGYSLYILRLSRHKNPSFGDVFDAFGVFLRAVWISILRSVVISLWSFVYAVPAALFAATMDPVVAAVICLPLLIPMFMAAYSYRLAVFIMLDEPAYSCGQCMALSRMAMNGRKWELFRLDLSFLGWILLSIVPFVGLYVEPYMGVTAAGWYDRVMPGFREDLQRQMQQRRDSGGYRPPSRGDYHIPGERHDDEDDPDSKE